MSKQLYIYIAGPYSSPDPEVNTLRVIEYADLIIEGGKKDNTEFVPFVPHLCHWWEMKGQPKPYLEWLNYTINWLKKCDFMFVIQESPGVLEEMKVAEELGIPVFKCEGNQLVDIINFRMLVAVDITTRRGIND